jgi:hypothetical protein
VRRGLALSFWTLLALVRASGAAASEGEDDRFRIGGLLFGDVYHVPSHHTDAGDGATGAVLRRGYLTFDADFCPRLEGRLRFEANQAGEFETYTFEADFKDLYLGWTAGRQRLVFGLSPTPTFDLIESVWGLRYLVRTPLDLQGVSSRDTGVSASGPLNDGGTLGYRAMAGAGLEFGHESGDGLKWMSALTWRPAPAWTLDLYFDHEKLSGRTDRTTLQAFAGYETEALRWGVQYSHQGRQDDPTLELASAFVVRRLGKRAALVARVDRLMEPSPKGDDIDYLPFDSTARATLFVGALELRVSKSLVVTPNTVITAYDRDDQGLRPRTDVHLRLTLFLDLE